MTIAGRILTIGERHQQATQLAEKADQSRSRREEAKHKNTAFQSLQQKLKDIQSEYKILQKWQALADEMGVSYDTDAVEHLKENMQNKLRTIINKGFDDFDDVQSIQEIEDEFSDYSTKIAGCQNDIQAKVESKCTDILDGLKTKQTVLRIPDIGDVNDEIAINNLREFLERIKNGNLPQDPVNQYEEHMERYEKVEISFDVVQVEYNIGNKAMDELKRLLNNEPITLSEIDEDVLSDLKNLSEFSQLITIQFTEGR